MCEWRERKLKRTFLCVCACVCAQVRIRWLWLISLHSRTSNSRLRWEWSLKSPSGNHSRQAGRQQLWETLMNYPWREGEGEGWWWEGGERGLGCKIVGEHVEARRKLQKDAEKERKTEWVREIWECFLTEGGKSESHNMYFLPEKLTVTRCSSSATSMFPLNAGSRSVELYLLGNINHQGKPQDQHQRKIKPWN